jgi:transcriptional regulator with XRE-family HTH domain
VDGLVADIRHLGMAICEIREETGLTSEELALAANVHPTHLNRAENHGKNLTWEKLSSLAKVLNVTVSAIAARAEEMARTGRKPKVKPVAD